jgi:hypothetical protein
MDFEFRHFDALEGNDIGDNIKSFELNLSRPIGINIEGKQAISFLS